MKKERRKEEMISSDDIRTVSSSKSKKRRSKKKNQMTINSMQNQLDILYYNLQTKPQKTIKRILIKTGLYLWSLAVFLSVLSLLGFPVSSLFFRDDELESQGPRVLKSSDDELMDSAGTTDFWSSFSSSFFLSSSDSLNPVEIDAEIEEREDPDIEEEVAIPEQVLPQAPKVGNKLNRKFEHELACVEEDCIASCNAKIKAKCSRSASCRKDRARLCKRRCRKQRCEDRCKDEPKFGYVEREQRMEKCKDECSGPTAVHNKCIKKCHSQFKPCKSRCHEISGKYVCNRVEVIPPQGKSDNDLDSLFDDPEVI